MNHLAPDRQGFQINGLRLLRQGRGPGHAFQRRHMAEALELAARDFYAGKIEAIDSFFQLYGIGEEARKKAKS